MMDQSCLAVRTWAAHSATFSFILEGQVGYLYNYLNNRIMAISGTSQQGIVMAAKKQIRQTMIYWAGKKALRQTFSSWHSGPDGLVEVRFCIHVVRISATDVPSQ